MKLLGQVHDQIRKAMESGNVAVVMSLLEQCQNAAIKIGELIERAEGEGFVTISMLEEYCELIYQIHEEMGQGRLVNSDNAYHLLRETLLQIENSIENDIKIRLEAVFLPCKASEWDSLESVWKAADEDPDCDAYVIPIPYYYKSPNGDFLEMHYEGDQYPKDVPVIRYDKFDFGQHHPDMIFIHNPYDEYNHAISVLPFFYSSNLKQFTDKLIYIPYFVLDEINLSNKRVVGSMEHFVAMPGVVNADKVIVQSEKMRQSYIDYLAKSAGEDTREVWEEKIVGWGSPRLDKVPDVKENLDIPEEWLKIIQKPDGSRKKIILYYTNVGILFQQGEQMLEKMRRTLKIFKKYQNEVALLWCPYLIAETNLKSRRPHLWTEYQKIVEEYKAEGWGIYDDSNDNNRAVLLSDACYGNWGRAVYLGSKGKKVMLMK